MRRAALRCPAHSLFWSRILLGFVRVALVAAALAATAGVCADDAAARFDAGVAAYRDGDTAAALSAFEQARAAGLDTPQLHFNLGLSYYRLARYAEARAAFEQLARFPEYLYVADYHLGLVAARAGQRDRAEMLLRSVEQDAPEAALRDRARIARARLDEAPGASGYLLALIGHDSNPALVDESLDSAGGGTRSTELFAAADLPLSRRGDVRLAGGAWRRDHDERPELDQRVLFAELSRERADGPRRRRLSFGVTDSALDGEDFSRTLAAQVEGRPATGRAGVTLRGQLARVDAADAYAHLEGWRLRGEAERATTLGRGRLRTGMQLEFNEREDLQAGAEFFSHSPLRARLSLAWDRPLEGAWSLLGSLRLRHSHFREPNVFLDGGSLREQRRTEDLLQAGLRARRRLGDSAGWLLEYQYSRNGASIEEFEYDRHLLLTGLEWLPRVN